MNFGVRLKALRKSSGMSRSQLAEQLNVSVSAIIKYESGSRYPDMDTLRRIAIIFKVTTDYLLGLDTSEKNFLDISPLPYEQREFLTKQIGFLIELNSFKNIS